MTISSAGPDGSRKYQPPVRESIEEQIRRRGIQPMTFPNEAPRDDVFESDEELDAFLTFVHAERHADLA